MQNLMQDLDWYELHPHPNARPRQPGEHDPENDPIYSLLFNRTQTCFAVLDAARVPNLVEQLEQSELEHRCLFVGQAEDDLNEVAPWLVRLEPENRFTENLLTDGPNPAPWHLWGYEPGVFVQSSLSFDEVWRHLRKFTQAPDQRGQNFFVRFWDPDFILTYLKRPEAPETPLIRSLFRPLIIDHFIAFNVFDEVVRVSFHADRRDWKVPPTPSFDTHLVDLIGTELANRRTARNFARDYPAILDDVPMAEIRDRIANARSISRRIGIDGQGMLGTFILLDVVYAPGFWRGQDFGHYWKTNKLEPNARFKAYLDVLKAELAKQVPDFKAWW
ncbi:DUF4123 domain-containing protein [uncultured Litoreibacter sp.]|uniref:DUF4123 domain-containing protein n=1 Tax=uncultured Litoreibacter sp. TaxID=1392394 RepID=UPI00261E6E82|nr:DUF4123 domain-containing protein [uncultured Litoreibacter sp.]